MKPIEQYHFSIDQLRLFLAVADEGSFSAAARKVRRSQSVVSYAVASLETQLGVQLFDRSEWKPRLTDAGRALRPDAEALVQSAGSFQAKAGGIAGGLEAELSIVVDVMYPLPVLVEALKTFRAEFPQTMLCLKVEALGAVAEPVLERTCQIGVMGSLPTRVPGLERVKVGEVQLLPVCSPLHPLAQLPTPIPTSSLSGHEQLVLTDRSELTRAREFGVLSDTKWRLADMGAKHSLLKAGLGWGFMPQPMVALDLADRTLVELAFEYQLPRGGLMPLYAVYRADWPPGPAGRWLIDRLVMTESASQSAATKSAPEC